MNIKILIVIILVFILYLTNNTTIEKFEDNDYFNKEYVDLYNSTFDFHKMYKNDIEIIVNKVIKNFLKNNNDIKILDAGCGLGKHMKYLYKKYNTIGVDRSKNMLQKAKISCPNGTFVLGDIVNSNLFDEQSIDLVYSLLDSLYHNEHKVQINILNNFKKWLKPDGYLCIHLFNKDKLDPGPMDFTQYSDINEVKNSVTHFDNYSHVANFNIKEDYVEYNEIYERDGKENITNVTKLYLDTKNVHIEKILSVGFKLIDVYSLKNIHIDDFELYVFKKN
jgi:SAM-dependent methyltransferase